MRVLSIFSLLFVSSIYISLINMVESRATRICTQCLTMEECELEPTEACMWGETRNECGRRVCAKGPGERCSAPGEQNIFGTCGQGMYCRTDFDRRLRGKVCHGCYGNTLDCYL